MVELKPKTQPEKTSKPKPTKTAMVFFNPVFERIVAVKEKDKETKYVVSEWTVKLRCGHFFDTSKHQDIEKQYQPLQEGQIIKSLTVVPSGKFFNLVGFEVGGSETKDEDPSSISKKFYVNSVYLVCSTDNVYPINETGLEELEKRINRTSKNKVSLEKLKELMVFKFSNNFQITFQQIGYGYHFLPVSLVLKLFRAGFQQFCTVVGLVYPNGDFVRFEPRPINYQTLIEKLKEVGVCVGSKIG